VSVAAGRFALVLEILGRVGKNGPWYKLHTANYISVIHRKRVLHARSSPLGKA